MRNLYAKFVLFLIRPAIDIAHAERLQRAENMFVEIDRQIFAQLAQQERDASDSTAVH